MQTSKQITSHNSSDPPRLKKSPADKRELPVRNAVPLLKQPLVYIALILAGIGFTVFSSHPEWFNNYNTKAASNTVQINLQPAQLFANPSATVQLWATTSGPTGFFQVEIDFTPSLIKLTSDVTLTSTTLTRVIKKTSYTDANSTGKLILALGLDPTQKANAPQGTMQIATLNFSAVTPVTVATTNITISGSTSSVVDMNAALMTISTSGTTASLYLPGDVSGPAGVPDGLVSLYDYSAIAQRYGQTGSPPGWITADVTGGSGVPDGVIDLFDLNVVIENYGRTN